MSENHHEGTFLRGPVGKHLLSNAGGVGLLPGWGTTIRHVTGQLSLYSTTKEPVCYKLHPAQPWIKLGDTFKNILKDKITIRYHYTPLKMAKIQKTKNIKCWWECWIRWILISFWYEYRMVKLLWKTVWQFLVKLNIHSSCDPTIILLPKRKNNIHLKTHIQICIAALCIIPKQEISEMSIN